MGALIAIVGGSILGLLIDVIAQRLGCSERAALWTGMVFCGLWAAIWARLL